MNKRKGFVVAYKYKLIACVFVQAVTVDSPPHAFPSPSPAQAVTSSRVPTQNVEQKFLPFFSRFLLHIASAAQHV